MSKTYAAQPNRLSKEPGLYEALEYLCKESNKLFNCTMYLARNLYFKTEKHSNGRWLSSQMKLNPHMKAMYTSAAQQTCISVGEAFKSFKELKKAFRNGKIPEPPKVPGYRSKGGLFQVSYPKRWLKLVDGKVRVPMGTACKVWFDLQFIFVPFPSNLDWNNIVELQIVPKAGYFEAVWVRRSGKKPSYNLDPNKVLSIDHGIDNWLTCVTDDDSFIIDGRHIKSVNQFYNKQVTSIKEGKPQGFWCNLLDRITTKRNRQMRDATNKAARRVVNYCLEKGIGTLVFGWNKGQKDGSNMGRKNNQKFVQIPTGKLKQRIQQLCEEYGIEFIEQEESYTSKASALDLDEIPVFGEKPETWKPSGRRVERGLYKSSDGTTVNADCNGAWNIGRKSNVNGMQRKPDRGVLTMPKRLRLWCLRPTLTCVVDSSTNRRGAEKESHLL